MSERERLILDRSGQAGVEEDYRVIDTEAEFLRTALRGDDQVVRGERLCRWAESFWKSRGWGYGEIRPPIADVLTACPDMDEEQAKALLELLGDQFYSLQSSLTALQLLRLAAPNGPWEDSPSPEHAAAWLVWLEEAAIKDCVAPLLSCQAKTWEDASEFAQRRLYRILDPAESGKLIGSWIGVESGDGTEDLGSFPIDVPQRWQQKARDKWKRDVVSAGVAVFDAVPASDLPLRIKEIAADEVCSYCIHHPQALTPALISRLAQLLASSRVQQLRDILPPDPPGTPPQEPEALSRWFVDQYLPYREWQAEGDDSAAREIVSSVVADFARWYLDYYPLAITGGPGNQHLAMRQSEAQRATNDGEVMLWVVLDGLHHLDAERLVTEIAEQTPTIQIDQVSTALAAIPTITKFAKPALVTGLPPAQAETAASPGTRLTVLAENADPKPAMKKARNGSAYLWGLSEPDKTYHKLTDRTTIGDNVYGVLKSLARKIAQAAEAVPQELPLRIVISTDHGRLLSGGKRTHSIPNGMDAEGRAAYGTASTSFGASGIELTEDGNVAILHGGRYGLPVDCAIALDEDAFVTSDGRGGCEQFPHGGLYPEEVLVPWVVLSRVQALPKVEGVIRGKARPTFDGTVTISLRNLSDSSVSVLRLKLLSGDVELRAVDLEGIMGPYDKTELQAVLRGWPTHEQIRECVAKVDCRLESGKEFEIPVRRELESEQMYKQDTTLEDL